MKRNNEIQYSLNTHLAVLEFYFSFPKLCSPRSRSIRGTVAWYCACTAMIDSGSWITNRNRQKWRPATMRILRESSQELHVWVWPVTMLVKDDQNVEKLYLYIELPHLCPNYIIGQKMLSEGRVRRIHTHALYILPAFMDVSRHRYLVSSPWLFCLFLSFFQTGFEAKAAFDSSRFVSLPTNRPASTSNFTIT